MVVLDFFLDSAVVMAGDCEGFLIVTLNLTLTETWKKMVGESLKIQCNSSNTNMKSKS
jgi:hypothetical protein